jgi:AraC family carnitine catabolism transcriptional activator
LFLHGEAPDGVSAPPTHGGGPVEQAIAIMRRNIEVPLSIPAIAARVDLTQQALGKAFTSKRGMSAETAYRRLRLDAACRRLDASDMPIAEIVLRCGWTDHSAFSRAFRREYGMTPKERRNPDSPTTSLASRRKG